MSKAIISAFAVLLTASALTAAIRTVPGEHPTIQAAIDVSNDGDLVVVSPGLYIENLDFSGKNITVRGLDPNDPETVQDTIIDGGNTGSVVKFVNGESQEAVLTGLTITNGYGTADPELFGDQIYWGAGVYIKESSPTITRCVFIENEGVLRIEQNNEALCYGGAMGLVLSEAVVMYNTFVENTAYAGAGLMTYAGDPLIANNLFYDNSAFIGGGVVIFGGRLLNNTIAFNGTLSIEQGEPGFAGNVYIAYEEEFGMPMAVGNLITNALSGGGVFHADLADEQFAYNDVWGNVPGNYLDQEFDDTPTYDGHSNRTGIAGNISQDPLYANPDARDFHLMTDSPCISFGDPSYEPQPGETDIDGDERIYAVRIDIGADEHVGYIRPVADAGDDQRFLTPQTVVLDGSGSFFYDANMPQVYSWEQISGPAVQLENADSSQPSFVASEYGYYAFELTVSDGDYVSTPDQVSVRIGNQHPTADAGADRAFQAPGTVTLDGSGSSDPDPGEILTYTWTQISGPPVQLVDADTATPSFECTEAGLYEFELTVSDGFVVSDPSRVKITTVTLESFQQLWNPQMGTSGYQRYPDISGNRIVCNSGGWQDYDWDIRYKAISSEDLWDFATPGIDIHPSVNGDIIVWSGGAVRPSPGYTGPINLSIIARDVVSEQQKVLRAHDDFKSYSHPAISGDKVVWLEHLYIDRNNPAQWEEMPFNLAGADISDFENPVYFQIAEEAGERDPYNYGDPEYDFDDVVDISGGKVVWESSGDIFGADISDINNIEIFIICRDMAVQNDPAICGNFVVWTDQRNDSGDIYGADISDPENIREMAIVTEPGRQLQPDIDEGLVVYISGSRYGGTIGAACIIRDASVLSVPMNSLVYGINPSVSGRYVVYQESSYGRLGGMILNVSYSVADGPVKNVTSGRHYDYIQHAVTAAAAGDRIVVSPGVYAENIDYLGKEVGVCSMDPNDPIIVESTVIDGGDTGPCVSFNSGENQQARLEGFTLANGSQGVLCSGSTPVIDKCRVMANSGPGILLEQESRPTLRKCVIMGNNGDGIYMPSIYSGRLAKHNRPHLRNVLIADNGGEGIGGGGLPELTNCTVVSNAGAGISCTGPIVINSIIYGNAAETDQVQMTKHYGSVSYSNVQGGAAGTGNIDIDPAFAEVNNRDYHLRSQTGRWDPNNVEWVQDAVTSPCIDAGDPNWPVGPEPDPNGGIVNMGAYGGTIYASMFFETGCLPQTHPDYDEWVQVGRPECWCYPRQCYGDADGKAEGGGKVPVRYVGINDLNVLIAAWNVFEPPDGPGIESVTALNGQAGICADFSHSIEGGGKVGHRRVGYCDLGRLIAHWRRYEAPDGVGISPDCGGTLEP